MAKRNKNKLPVEIGYVTPEGKSLVKGVYSFYETHGVPLEILFEILDQKNYMPSWLHFYDEARAAGIQHSRVLSWLEPALADIYGRDFKNEVMSRLSKHRPGDK